MRALVALLVACASPAPPAIHNEAGAGSLWCSWLDGEVACFTGRADCMNGRTRCAEIVIPQWTCARVFHRADHTLAYNSCYPSPALCATDEVFETNEREACTPATSVYCRDFEGSIACHPTRAICERAAVGFAGHIRPVSPCTPR